MFAFVTRLSVASSLAFAASTTLTAKMAGEMENKEKILQPPCEQIWNEKYEGDFAQNYFPFKHTSDLEENKNV
eukprot:Awhi_evm1s648